jgi:O-antigen/teichoic acid export membrane protein
MRLRQLAVDAVVWTGIRNWGSQASSFLVFLVLARLLPPEAFGLVAFAATLLAFAQIVINQGFALAIVQRERLDPEHIDTAFWTGIGLSLVLVAFVVGLAEPIAALAGEPELAPLLPWLSLGILLGSLSAVHVALLQRELRFRLLTLRTLVASTIGGLTGVAMALSGFGVWSLVGQQLTTMGVSVLVLWTSSDWRPGIRVSRTHFGDLFQFGISIVGSNIARFFARRSDRLLIGYLLGPAELGIYVIAFRTVDALIDLVNASLRQVAVPVFSRMQGDPTRLLRALYSATRTTSLVSFPAFAGLAALAPELVPALFGSQWEASIPIRFGKLLGGYVVPAFGSAVVALIAIGITWTIGKHVSVYFTLATSTAAAALAYLLLIRVGAPDRYEAARELLVLALPSRLASKPKDAPEPREA